MQFIVGTFYVWYSKTKKITGKYFSSFKKNVLPYLIAMKAKSRPFVIPHWNSLCVFKFHMCPQSLSPPSALRHCLFNLDSHSGWFLPWVCLLLKRQSYEGQAWRKHFISWPSAAGEGIRFLLLWRRTNSSLYMQKERILLLFTAKKKKKKN